jgi:hypothetical protein
LALSDLRMSGWQDRQGKSMSKGLERAVRAPGMLRLPALALAVALCAGQWGCAAHQEEDAPVTAGADESQLQAQGVQLRQAIQAAYERLGRNGGVDRQHGNDISADVTPFFSTGEPFEQAEAVLRGAGFTVPPRPAPGATADPAASDVKAVIDPFMPPFICRTSVELSLRPQVPFDYRTLGWVNARFKTVCQ